MAVPSCTSKALDCKTHMEHVFQCICSMCSSRHKLRTACCGLWPLSCRVSWFAGEANVALEDRVLLQPSMRERLLTHNRQSNKNTLHSTLRTKARSAWTSEPASALAKCLLFVCLSLFIVVSQTGGIAFVYWQKRVDLRADIEKFVGSPRRCEKSNIYS